MRTPLWLAAATSVASIAFAQATEQAKPHIGVLVNALKDDDADVRKSALTALGNAKADVPTMMPGLIAIVKNAKEDKAVRISAVTLLGSGGPNAKEALPFLEFIHSREAKKDEKDRDKELFEKLTEAIAAIKK